MGTPKDPLIDDWAKKWCIYTVEYYSAIRIDEILPFATTRVNLANIVLSQVRQKKSRIL